MSSAIVIPRDPRFKDLTDRTFGKLTVLGYAGKIYGRHSAWQCKCQCGAIVVVERGNLVRKVRSCQPCGHKTHGQSRTPEHRAWLHMRERCRNPKCKHFKDYGGRGITICRRWESFENFWADMGPRPSSAHSIERKDNDGNYEPGNCIWATQSQQTRNTRVRRRHLFNGELLLLCQWAEKLGIPRAVLSNRLYDGWTLSRTLTTPYGPVKRKKPKRRKKAEPLVDQGRLPF